VYATNVYGGVDVKLLSFLTSPLDGHDWSASDRDTFTLSGNAVLDTREKEKKKLVSSRNGTKFPASLIQPVAIWNVLYTLINSITTTLNISLNLQTQKYSVMSR